eukprot:gene25228-11040_t
MTQKIALVGNHLFFEGQCPNNLKCKRRHPEDNEDNSMPPMTQKIALVGNHLFFE